MQLQTVRVTEMLDELDRFEKKLKGRPVPAPPSSARAVPAVPPPKPSPSAVAAAQPVTSAEGDVPTDAAGTTDATPAGETVADHD